MKIKIIMCLLLTMVTNYSKSSTVIDYFQKENIISTFIDKHYTDTDKKERNRIEQLLQTMINALQSKYNKMKVKTNSFLFSKVASPESKKIFEESLIIHEPLVHLLSNNDFQDPNFQYFCAVIKNTCQEKKMYTNFVEFYGTKIPSGATFSEVLKFWSNKKIYGSFLANFLPIIDLEQFVLDEDENNDQVKNDYINMVGNFCSLLQSDAKSWNHVLEQYAKNQKIIENMVIGALQLYIFTRITQMISKHPQEIKKEDEQTESAPSDDDTEKNESHIQEKQFVIPDYFIETALRALKKHKKSSLLLSLPGYTKYLASDYLEQIAKNLPVDLKSKLKEEIIKSIEKEIMKIAENAKGILRGIRQNIWIYFEKGVSLSMIAAYTYVVLKNEHALRAAQRALSHFSFR